MRVTAKVLHQRSRNHCLVLKRPLEHLAVHAHAVSDNLLTCHLAGTYSLHQLLHLSPQLRLGERLVKSNLVVALHQRQTEC